MKSYIKPKVKVILDERDVLSASIEEKDNFMGFEWDTLDEKL